MRGRPIGAPEPDYARVLRDVRRGVSVSDLADAYRVCPRTIRRWAKRAEVEERRCDAAPKGTRLRHA